MKHFWFDGLQGQFFFYFLGWFEGLYACIFFQNYGLGKKTPTIWIKFYTYKIDISKNRK